MSASLMSLVWFVAVLVCIPLALLLVKRSGLAVPGAMRAPQGAPRIVSSLGMGAQQRLVTVEVGEGEQRRWLVLGVTAQNMSTLHTIDHPPEAAAADAAVPPPAFAQVLGRVLGRPSSGSASQGGRDGR